MAIGAAVCFSAFAVPSFAQVQEDQTETQTESQTSQDYETGTQDEMQTEPQTEPRTEDEIKAEDTPQEQTETGYTEDETAPQEQSDINSQSQPPADIPATGQSMTSDDLSDEQLQAFVNSANRVMAIHEEAEEKMVQTIEEHNLDVETFNQILQARQTEQVPEADPEKVEAFQKAFPEVLNEQQRVNAKIEASLQEEGLDIQTYENIMMAYQQDPEVQQRVNELIQKNEGK